MKSQIFCMERNYTQLKKVNAIAVTLKYANLNQSCQPYKVENARRDFLSSG
jgi:hypothetical protein